VGMETPWLPATSIGGAPVASSFLTVAALLAVIYRFRSSMSPSLSGHFEVSAGPIYSSFFFHHSARLSMAWKKKPPDAVPI